MARRFIAAALGIASATWASSSVAQPTAESMQGRNITLYISVGPGGGYDSYGRMVARGLARHIPGNPTIVPSNMPGGGGRVLSNYMYNVAPKDGTAIAIVQHTTVYDAIFGEQGVRFDSSKLNWIGSAASMTFMALVWHTTGVTSVEDARKREVTVGATGPGATSFQYPALLNALFGTRLKIITGYKGSPEVYHAVEQRELDGTGGFAWEVVRNARPQWFEKNQVNVIVQFALKRHADLPSVPTIIELARNAEEKQLLEMIFKGLQFGMPFMVPPGVAPERVKMLRTAMTALASDPEFIAEAKQRKLSIDHTDGETVQRLVGEIQASPQEMKVKARSLLAGK